MFEEKVVVVTGGAKGIGKAIADQFRSDGAHVCVIDLLEQDGYVGDLAEQAVLEEFAQSVIQTYGTVDVLVNNALPLMKGIDTCSYEEFNYALRVGVTAPFYLSKLFLPYFSPGASIILLLHEPQLFNQQRMEIMRLVRAGKLFVLEPDRRFRVERVERDPSILEEGYRLGREAAETHLPDLFRYLQG